MTGAEKHIDSHDLELLVAGLDGEMNLEQISAHLEGCQQCQGELAGQVGLELQLRSLAGELSVCVGCGDLSDGARCRRCGAASVVGDYHIEKLIVQNSRGRIYRARGQDGAVVALKELAFVQAPSTEEIDAFERESTILRTLSHPGIPRFVASFCDGEGVDTRLYLAQEFIDGQSVESLLADSRFDERRALDLARQVLEILAYLQSLSPMVFHRDVKPSNLLLRADGRVALVDFGAARGLGPTAGATQVGTFGYMPVEQLGGIVDATTDLYALGATLFELLSRREPWQLLEDERALERMNIGSKARRFIRGLVARRSRDRFASAGAALAALDRLTADGEAHRSAAAKRATDPDSGWRLLQLAGLGVGLAAVVSVGALGVSYFRYGDFQFGYGSGAELELHRPVAVPPDVGAMELATGSTFPAVVVTDRAIYDRASKASVDAIAQAGGTTRAPDRERLEQHLRARRQSQLILGDANPPLVIEADGRVEHEVVLEVIKTATVAGYSRFEFAVSGWVRARDAGSRVLEPTRGVIAIDVAEQVYAESEQPTVSISHTSALAEFAGRRVAKHIDGGELRAEDVRELAEELVAYAWPGSEGADRPYAVYLQGERRLPFEQYARAIAGLRYAEDGAQLFPDVRLAPPGFECHPDDPLCGL